jgi:hypothetical protein
MSSDSAVFGLHDILYTIFKCRQPLYGYRTPHQPEIRAVPYIAQAEGEGLEQLLLESYGTSFFSFRHSSGHVVGSEVLMLTSRFGALASL